MKIRHKKGIVNYQKWLEANPDASRERRIKAFDTAMDVALEVQRENRQLKKATKQKAA
jgi:hypothetical protein